MDTTEFMLQLARSLITERKITESSANAYIKVLYAMNEKKAFKNLTFLKAVDAIDTKIKTYAESTQRAITASIVSVLSLYKDKPTFKKPYEHFYADMMKGSKEASEEAKKNEKTPTQKDNWISWADVEKKKRELVEDVEKFKDAKELKVREYETLLQLLVLSLYTDVAPRRNQDYLDMYIVKKHTAKMPTDKNYLDVSAKKFIFNKYKTAKKYGPQTEEIPATLWERVELYLTRHPTWKGKGTAPIKFLVTSKGEGIVALNAITRILNKIFDKKIGATMLRHIYLSDKFGDTLEDMKKTATGMGHSINVQRAYIKKDEDANPISPPPPAPPAE